MNDLVNEMAELLYMAEGPSYPWDKALKEDVEFYTRVAQMMLDAVVDHLASKDRDAEFSGGLAAAVEYLRTIADISRLRTYA